MLSAEHYTILLQHLPDTGAGVYWKLLEQFPSLKSAFEAPIERLSALLSPKAIALFADYRRYGSQSQLGQTLQADIEWCNNNGVQLLHIDNENYPKLLREVKKAPPLLYVLGNPNVLSLPQIAIVGSRSPSPGGRNNAYDFAVALAKNGLTITSGLALGVDIAAHEGTLKAEGKTIAILGTGIDQIYPQRHQFMAQQIVATGGAVISEFPLKTPPIPANFPQRNRIISGLTAGVLVVEAAVKSGSLITARYALSQNREVFAIPGSIHNPLSKGCHALIKEGAKLVESADDIIEELQGYLAFKWEETAASKKLKSGKADTQSINTDSEKNVLIQVGYDSSTLDEICERTTLPIGEVLASLLALELKGLVANHGSGYSRVRSTISKADLSMDSYLR